MVLSLSSLYLSNCRTLFTYLLVRQARGEDGANSAPISRQDWETFCASADHARLVSQHMHPYYQHVIALLVSIFHFPKNLQLQLMGVREDHA